MVSSSSCVLVLLLVVGTRADTIISPIIPTEGEEYMLDCDGSGDLRYFLLHQQGKVLVPGFYETLEIHVFRNASVFFESISVKHEGTHLCIRDNEVGESQAFPTPLRVRPLPSDDLWNDVYEAKFVTGFIAALTIAALFVLGCLVQKYRWRPTETDGERILSSNAYVNTAMISEDAESGCSTKM